MRILIKGGAVLDGECREFYKSDVLIDGGIIKEIGKISDTSADKTIVADGKCVIPGFIDIHTHGSFGVDFSQSVSFDDVRTALAREGITSVSPTISTRPKDMTVSAINHLVSESKKRVGATLEKIHLEGPFLSPEKMGAMEFSSLECTAENFDSIVMNNAAHIGIVTIAPELEGAVECIRRASACGIRMSLGHTVADYEQAIRAIDAGATGATHTFNAMRPYEHRETGVLGAVLTDDRVMCEMICDFVHLAPETVKLIIRAKGIDRVALIDDAAMITGMPDGVYFTNKRITVKNRVARNDRGRLASSCYTMTDGARNLLKLGISLADVSRMGAYNPAVALGIENITGSVMVGKRADVIVTDDKLAISSVISAGELVVDN